jgi:hypothetical protein
MQQFYYGSALQSGPGRVVNEGSLGTTVVFGPSLQSGPGRAVNQGVLGRALGMMTGPGRAFRDGSLGDGASTIGLSYDAMLGLVLGAAVGIFYVKQQKNAKRA